MSVRSFPEVITEQVTLTLLAAVPVFVLSAWVALHALNNLLILATTPANSGLEWLATTAITAAMLAGILGSLKVMDRELEVEP